MPSRESIEARYPWIPYVLPFAVFVLLLAAAGPATELFGRWEPAVRALAITAVLAVFSRRAIDWRLRNAIGSVALGAAVFVLWIGPDLLFPAYRDHWLLQNQITGELRSSVRPEDRGDALVLFFRALRAIILVPILEELFWRGFLMRWLIDTKFQTVPLGAYTAQSFWIVAVLFASEHGPFWDVGLIAGVLYNWWVIRTKSLADCILAHAVTNAALSAYVLITGKWQYWM